MSALDHPNVLTQIIATVISKIKSEGKIKFDGGTDLVVHDSTGFSNDDAIVAALMEAPLIKTKFETAATTAQAEIDRLTRELAVLTHTPSPDATVTARPPVKVEEIDISVALDAKKRLKKGDTYYVRRALKAGESIKKGDAITIDDKPTGFTLVRSRNYILTVGDFIGRNLIFKPGTKKILGEDEFITKFRLEDTDEKKMKYCMALLIDSGIIDIDPEEMLAQDLPSQFADYLEAPVYGSRGASAAAAVTPVAAATGVKIGAPSRRSGGSIDRNTIYHTGGVDPSIVTILKNMIAQRDEFLAETADPTTAVARIRQLRPIIARLNADIVKINTDEFTKYMSTRNVSGKTFKIDQNVLMINEAIEAINANRTYQFKDINQISVGVGVSTFEQLRKHIVDYMNDYTQLLLLLSQSNPISLEALMPSSEITPSKYKLSEKAGVLMVEFNGDEELMPHITEQRKEYSKAAVDSGNKCYGFTDNKGTNAQAFCVDLLIKCLADDDKSLKKCKELFQSDTWRELVQKGIKNTNIYLIEKFLLAIGYPMIQGIFSSSMEEWFDVMKIRYSLKDDEYTKIIANKHLQQAIELMVEKYNIIVKQLKGLKQNAISTLAPSYGPHAKIGGGDLLNINLNLSGGASILNLNKSSPSESIHKIFTEIVKDSEIAKSYKDFFTKMENKIKTENKEISSAVKSSFENELQSFRKSEEKLNKLSQLMHNFAWYLGVTVNDSNLSEEQKALNKKAQDILKTGNILNEDKIKSYNEIREKLSASLKKKTNTMLALLSPFPFLFVQ